MMNTACSIQRSGSDLSGENSVGPGTVNDRIVLSRGRVHPHLEETVSMPVPEFIDTDEPGRREANCYVFENALRGLVYAFLPSVVFWAILIGMTYSLVKR